MQRVLVVLPPIVAALLGTAPALAQIDQNQWITSGVVHAVAERNGTVYVGGSFEHVGPATGGLAIVDAGTAELAAGHPKVTGRMIAAAPDGAGGWYIGGKFSHVNGVPRSSLAHLNADLSLSSWAPAIVGAGFDTVTGIAVSGSSVIVAGSFVEAGGQPRNDLAALDATTGLATPWDPDVSGRVNAIALTGGTLYVGGQFTAIGGVPRRNVAKVDVATGAVAPWDPHATDEVYDLHSEGTLVWVAGRFTEIGGKPRTGVAAIHAVTGNATDWDPHPYDDFQVHVRAVVVAGSTVYLGGSFDGMWGANRRNLASVDAETAIPSGWSPNPGNTVNALAVQGSTLWAGGYFSSVFGTPREHLASFDVETGVLRPWDAHLDGAVVGLVAGESHVLAGGYASLANGVTRTNVAAFDAATGVATPWNPYVSGAVNALAVGEGVVYLGGRFSNVGGQTRHNVAAVDASTGLVTSWDPDADDDVNALLADGPVVIAGGLFGEIGGASRTLLAELDAITGTATAFDPDVSGPSTVSVDDVAVRGNTVYAGGQFRVTGLGYDRFHLVAFDLTTGSVVPSFDPPEPDLPVRALAIAGSTLYFGGRFSTLDGALQRYAAAFDLDANELLPWSPDVTSGITPNQGVRDLLPSGSLVYIAGQIHRIGGELRPGVGAVDAVTAAVTPWAPGLPLAGSPICSAVLATGSEVHVGGTFSVVEGLPHASFFSTGSAATDVPLVSAPGSGLRLENLPDPFRAATTIRFVLPRAASVRLDVFDIAGRRVATPLRDRPYGPGAHALEWAPRRLPGGVYLYRVQAGDLVESDRLVLLR